MHSARSKLSPDAILPILFLGLIFAGEAPATGGGLERSAGVSKREAVFQGEVAPSAIGTGFLTTHLSGGTMAAGNTFDLESFTPLTITGFDVHLSAGSETTVRVHWKQGTADGFESDASAWTLLGSDLVTPAGQGQATHVDVGGLHLQPGDVYGFYVDVWSHPSSELIYSSGGPTEFSNNHLKLTTRHGKGSPAFTGDTHGFREWNGTVRYVGAEDCGGGEIYDDGEPDNAYSGNPSQVETMEILQRFTPTAFPATYHTSCLALTTLSGGSETLAFEIVAYANDGVPDGTPGTELGAVAVAAVDIPVWPDFRFYEFDISELDLTLEAGSVFLGMRWSPPEPVNIFMAADESPETPFNPGFANFNTGDGWQPLETVFSNYSALTVRALVELPDDIFSDRFESEP